MDNSSVLFRDNVASLKSIRETTQALVDCKASLLERTESLEHKQQLLEEIISERQRLKKEKRILLEMIQGVQRDIETVTDAETSLKRECEALQLVVKRIRAEEYEPLYDQVNQIRAENGQPKLTHIEHEIEAKMAKMLEERREKWHQHTHTPSPDPLVSSSIRRSTNSTRSRRRRQ